jgi:hypothetical protein
MTEMEGSVRLTRKSEQAKKPIGDDDDDDDDDDGGGGGGGCNVGKT